MKYPLLWGGALFGVVLHLAGLGIDVYLHAHDSTLASRESLFTLSNPGHALIVVGMAVTAVCVLAVAFAWAEERSLGGAGRLAVVARALLVPAVGLAAFGTVWLASLAEDVAGHDHAADATSGHPHDVVAVPNVATAGDAGHGHTPETANVPLDEGNAHTHGVEVPVTAEQLAAASTFVARVKAATAKYEDIRVAMADGYFQLTQDLPAIAAHFMNARYNSDGVLMDPEKPEFLLYTKRLDGTWRLVGAMFTSEKVTPDPPSFFGRLDVWHRHENLCFTPNAVSVKASAAECPGVFTKETPWNLHVWTAPGDAGVFAHDFPPINPGAFPGATRPAAQDVLVRAP